MSTIGTAVFDCASVCMIVHNVHKTGYIAVSQLNTQMPNSTHRRTMFTTLRTACTCASWTLLAPGSLFSSCLIPDSIQGVQHGHVGGQSLLGDHVPHQHHKVVIWQAVCALSQLCQLQRHRCPYQQKLSGATGGDIKERDKAMACSRHVSTSLNG